MAFGNPSPLEVEFQTQSYFKIWSSVLKLRSLVGLEVIFLTKTLFSEMVTTYGST